MRRSIGIGLLVMLMSVAAATPLPTNVVPCGGKDYRCPAGLEFCGPADVCVPCFNCPVSFHRHGKSQPACAKEARHCGGCLQGYQDQEGKCLNSTEFCDETGKCVPCANCTTVFNRYGNASAVCVLESRHCGPCRKGYEEHEGHCVETSDDTTGFLTPSVTVLLVIVVMLVIVVVIILRLPCNICGKTIWKTRFPWMNRRFSWMQPWLSWMQPRRNQGASTALLAHHRKGSVDQPAPPPTANHPANLDQTISRYPPQNTNADGNTGDLRQRKNIKKASGKDVDTPLHGACRKGELDIVASILSRGADIEAKGWGGHTPLIAAAEEGHLAVVTLLLEKGANVEGSDEDGQTALHWASGLGYEQVVALLLSYRADVNVEDKKGRTPLGWAALRGHLAVVTLLLEKGAIVRGSDGDGWTALHRASYKGHEQVVALLLRHRVDVNVEDNMGRTPLNVAADGGHLAVVTLLLEKGAIVHGSDKYGMTALHWASVRGHEQVVALLLDYKTDVNLKDHVGRTPLDVATEGKHSGVVKLLTAAGGRLGKD